MHRKIKNVVHNYTPSEVKVREATSNDPWGPSSALMSEIAEMTYDVLALTEMMPMIWKRLNDSGKNWRHVYKSLVLLEFLARAGSDKIVRQCQDQIILIQTLRDFQYVENGLDHGLNVREKAKVLYSLLNDEERLRNERARAASARSRFGGLSSYAMSEPQEPSYNPSSSAIPERQNSPYFADSIDRPTQHMKVSSTPSNRPAPGDPEIESVRPSTTNEEELQLQLALAMSKEEHDEEIKKRKGDEMKLQMALEESRKTAQLEQTRRKQTYSPAAGPSPAARITTPPRASSVPLNQALVDPWSVPPPSVQQTQAVMRDPWNPSAGATKPYDPWKDDRSPSPVVYTEVMKDYTRGYVSTDPAPWEEVSAKFNTTNFETRKPVDDFSELSARSRLQVDQSAKSKSIENWLDNNVNTGIAASVSTDDDNLWDINETDNDLLGLKSDPSKVKAGKKMTPEEFLGANAKLVDFDDLVSKPNPVDQINPFAMTIGKGPAVNPFLAKAQQEEKSKRVPLNLLQPTTGQSGSAFSTQLNPAFNQPSVPLQSTSMAGFQAPTLAVVYTQQPIIQNQGYNPFL